jgi:hypothetical protein
MLPIYTVIVFSGYIFMQFCRTISENFKQLRHDIGEKSRQVKISIQFANKIQKKRTKILLKKKCYARDPENIFPSCLHNTRVISVVEFSREGYKIRKVFGYKSIFQKETIVFCKLM